MLCFVIQPDCPLQPRHFTIRISRTSENFLLDYIINCLNMKQNLMK